MDAEARDSDLVQRAQIGDKAALGVLLARHRPLAERLALRLLDDWVEAEDVTQEACLQAFLSLGRLRQPERFGSWLAGIALNLARMRRRARRWEAAWDELEGGRLAGGFTLADLPLSLEATLEVREAHRVVQQAILALPADQQAAVTGHYLDGLTLSEIAALVGAPLGTVKARLHRARARLRAHLLAAADLPTFKEILMIEVVIHDVLMRVPPPAGDVVEAAGREVPPPEAAPVRVRLPEAAPAQFVVVLKERAGGRVLPIWIGPHEAQLIKWQMAGGTAPRPLTYELMARLLAAAGARVERITVSRLQAEVFYATILLAAPAPTPEVDARPSDALALAQRLEAPIFVDADVLAQAGLAEPDLPAHLEAQTRPAGAPETQPAGAVLEWQWVPAPAPSFGRPPPR